MKKSFFYSHFLLLFVLPFLFCCQRELKDDPTSKEIDIEIDSPIKSFTENDNAGFINTAYDMDIAIKSRYKTGIYPVFMTYECSKPISISLGTSKYYSESDTISMSLKSPKSLKVAALEPGNYRLYLYFKDDKGQNIGTQELNFNINEPDLTMQIIKDGVLVSNLNETPNYQGLDGSFTIRVTSNKVQLNNGKLSLKVNFSGSAVNVLNWVDNDIKVSREGDDESTVEFKILYKNASTGTTKFTFKAFTEVAEASQEIDMTVTEISTGELNLATEIKTDSDGKNYYNREKIWVGQTDSIDYIIAPDINDPIKQFNVKFEMTDPQKINIFSTGDPLYQNQYTRYDVNTYYDFTNKLTGKFYIVFTSLATYADTITLTMKNGSGAEKQYKLYLGCKQTEDFNFDVSFKPSLEDGYDVIKYSELQEILLKNSVILNVSDENPYNNFDYKFSYLGTNSRQNQLAHAFQKNNVEYVYPLADSWLGNEYGYIQGETKVFALKCLETPTSNDYVGMFNWEYTVKRTSDHKTKTVTRKIKIIDDRLSFGFELSPLNIDKREYVYINEPHTMYRILYQDPSPNSSEYSVRFSSSDESIADIYLVNDDATYRKVEYNQEHIAPASHNQQQTGLGDLSGSIRIKGKKEGRADLSFVVKHVQTNTEKTFTKSIEVRNDPISYTITPSNPIDNYGKTLPAPSFGSDIHVYKPCGFKLKVNSNAMYPGNTQGKAIVKININTTNSHTIYLNNTHTNGSVIEVDYDKEYEFLLSDSPSGGWSQSGINALISCSFNITSANNEETQITTNTSDDVQYRIVAYSASIIQIVDYVYKIEGYDWLYDETWGTSSKLYKSITYTNSGKVGQLPNAYYDTATIDFTFSGESEEFYIPSSIKSQILNGGYPGSAFPTGHRSHVVEIKDNWNQHVATWEIDIFNHP